MSKIITPIVLTDLPERPSMLYVFRDGLFSNFPKKDEYEHFWDKWITNISEDEEKAQQFADEFIFYMKTTSSWEHISLMWIFIREYYKKLKNTNDKNAIPIVLNIGKIAASFRYILFTKFYPKSTLKQRAEMDEWLNWILGNRFVQNGQTKLHGGIIFDWNSWYILPYLPLDVSQEELDNLNKGLFDE